MAQLRQEYEQFVAEDAVIVVVAPDDPAAVKRYWQQHDLPFIGLADPKHTVADAYGQQVKWLKLGRMPALVIVDKQGGTHYRHFGASMSDIPPNDDVLAVLRRLNQDAASG